MSVHCFYPRDDRPGWPVRFLIDFNGNVYATDADPSLCVHFDHKAGIARIAYQRTSCSGRNVPSRGWTRQRHQKWIQVEIPLDYWAANVQTDDPRATGVPK